MRYRMRKLCSSVLLGATFVWNGDLGELDEGICDVKSWEEKISWILDC